MNEDKIVELYKNGVSYKEIERVCDCSKNAISNAINRRNLEKRRVNIGHIKKEIVKMALNGMTRNNIASNGKFSRDQISKVASQFLTDLPNMAPRSVRKNNVKRYPTKREVFHSSCENEIKFDQNTIDSVLKIKGCA